jgi:ABC-type polysaccharide/polyol phosphate export permease
MKPLLLLVRLRLLEIFRDRSTGLFFLGLPLLFFGLVGVIFAHGHPFERRRLAIVDAAAAPEVLAAVARFAEIRVERTDGAAAARGQLRAHVVNGVLEPGAGGLRLVVGANDELFGRGLAAALPGAVQLEVAPATRWGFVHYAFPGMLVFCIVIAGLFGMGFHMVRYRQNLFLRKLSTTRLSKSTFVAAQIAGRGVYVLGQALLLLAAAHLVFRFPLSAAGAAWALALSALGLCAFLGIGFVLACFIRTEALIYDAISAIAWPVVLLSELFFPADELPAPLPLAAAALPSTQLVRLLRAVLLYGETGAARLAPGIAIIVMWIAVTFALGRWLFRWND